MKVPFSQAPAGGKVREERKNLDLPESLLNSRGAGLRI